MPFISTNSGKYLLEILFTFRWGNDRNSYETVRVCRNRGGAPNSDSEALSLPRVIQIVADETMSVREGMREAKAVVPPT